MADTKISALPAATDLTSAVIPIVQGGTNKKADAGLVAQPAAITAAGDITNLAVSPVVGLDKIYTARITTTGGTLTITAPASGAAFAQVRLTSDADGTKEIGVAAHDAHALKWADGIALPLAPKTGETIKLFIECYNGAIELSASIVRTLA